MIILIKRSFRVGLLKRFCWSFYEIRWVFFFFESVGWFKGFFRIVGVWWLIRGILGDSLGLIGLFEGSFGIG